MFTTVKQPPPPHIQGTALCSGDTGLRVKPTGEVRSSSSSETPGGGVKRKCCRRLVKKMKSSILARPSPGQILRPERERAMETFQVICQSNQLLKTSWSAYTNKPAEKGMKASRLTNFPSLSKKWAGWKECGLSHSLSSNRTDIKRGYTVVPWGQFRNLVIGENILSRLLKYVPRQLEKCSILGFGFGKWGDKYKWLVQTVWNYIWKI